MTNEDVKNYMDTIEPIWHNTCLWHFHDCIPGSAINEVNYDAISEGRVNLSTLRDLERELGNKLANKVISKAGKDQKFILNTLSHNRIIQNAIIPGGGWDELQGQIIRPDNRVTEQYRRVGDGYEVIKLNEPFYEQAHPGYKDPKILFDAESLTVTTPFFTVKFNKTTNNIYSVLDKESGAEYLSGENTFELYEDRPRQYPNWNIDYSHKEMQLQDLICDKLTFDAADGVVRRHCYTAPIGQELCGVSEVFQNITFSSRQPFVDFSTIVNWTMHDKLLKVAFPTTIRSPKSRMGIQFGHIQRPTHNNTDRDWAKFETYGRWANLAEQSRGVCIMSDIKGGFDVHEQVVRLSLLKSTMEPDRWQDFGVRKFFYRGVFHNSDWLGAKIPQLHDELVHQPVLIEGDPDSTGTSGHTESWVVVDDDWVILDTLKVTEAHDGFIARFYDASGGARRAKVEFPLLKSSDWSELKIVDLLEDPYGDTIAKLPGESLSFYVTVKAFEIVSVKITRAKK
jgi:alpha-mannosidase